MRTSLNSQDPFFFFERVFFPVGELWEIQWNHALAQLQISLLHISMHTKGRKKVSRMCFVVILSAYSFSFYRLCLTHMDSLQVFSATCRRFAFLMSASVLVPLMCRTWIELYWWSSTLHVLHFHCVLSNQWGGCCTQYSIRKMSAHVELFSDFKILWASLKKKNHAWISAQKINSNEV